MTPAVLVRGDEASVDEALADTTANACIARRSVVVFHVRPFKTPGIEPGDFSNLSSWLIICPAGPQSTQRGLATSVARHAAHWRRCRRGPRSAATVRWTLVEAAPHTRRDGTLSA